MAELFAVGSFWFWSLVAVEIFLLFIFTENENGVASTISVGVFAALLQWGSGIDIIEFVITSPMKLLAMIAAYFAAGTLWATAKWWLKVRDTIEDVKEFQAEWFKEKGYHFPPVADSEEAKEWKKERRKRGLTRPRIRDYKGDFFRWMTFWWISMAWTLCADFVKRIVKEIYRKLQRFLQAMSDNMWRKAGFDPDEDD